MRGKFREVFFRKKKIREKKISQVQNMFQKKSAKKNLLGTKYVLCSGLHGRLTGLRATNSPRKLASGGLSSWRRVCKIADEQYFEISSIISIHSALFNQQHSMLLPVSLIVLNRNIGTLDNNDIMIQIEHEFHMHSRNRYYCTLVKPKFFRKFKSLSSISLPGAP
jgi:hypothetical protein